MLLIKIKSSPYKEDQDIFVEYALPWLYDEDNFCCWVWEVLMEGYKHDIPVPDLFTALKKLHDFGYTWSLIYRE